MYLPKSGMLSIPTIFISCLVLVSRETGWTGCGTVPLGRIDERCGLDNELATYPAQACAR